VFSHVVHTYLGVPLLSSPSCSAAEAAGDPTPCKDALLGLDILMVEVGHYDGGPFGSLLTELEFSWILVRNGDYIHFIVQLQASARAVIVVFTLFALLYAMDSNSTYITYIRGRSPRSIVKC
jgi:hypothetical protein